MSRAEQLASPKNSEYATAADFCRIFNQQMKGLYLLALLLTGDREPAEHCFVTGLEDSVENNSVFKEWAHSWAKRTIIQNAVRMINPRPVLDSAKLSAAGASTRKSVLGGKEVMLANVEQIAAVLRLPSFDRFVFVLAVLEKYSDQDCVVLLGCTRRDVITARTLALQQLGSSAEFSTQEGTNTGSGNIRMQAMHGSAVETQAYAKSA